jgi:putative hydrolase of HD superfamily
MFFVSRDDGVQRIANFILELDKLKSVERKTRPLSLDRFENSAEHSWQIAVLATLLSQFAPQPVDIGRVVNMLLLHDVGEIDTGDTIVYAVGGWDERNAAELAAVQRMCKMLPAEIGVSFVDLWREFNDAKTPEARFAHAADRAMPVLLNLANNGQSWRENGISYQQVVDRNGPPIQQGCPALWEYLENRLNQARRDGWFGELL